MDQAIQIIGSLLVLIPFVLAQLGRMRTSSLPYLILNFIGSAGLTGDAAKDSQWGFVLLNGVWAVVCLRTIVKHAR